MAGLGWPTAAYANLVRQAKLDGGTVTAVKDVVVPKPLLTTEEQQKLKSAGKYPTYEDTMPRQEGLINLRGLATAAGTVSFVAQQPGIQDGPPAQQTARRSACLDG